MLNVKKLSIYYDGTCTACSKVVEKIRSSSQNEKFEPIDITHAILPKGITSAQAQRDVHAIDEYGKQYVGIDAVVRILREYPHWRPIARIISLPGIKQGATLIYRIVAANRHWYHS